MAQRHGTCNCGRGLANVKASMFGRTSMYCRRCVEEYEDAQTRRECSVCGDPPVPYLANHRLWKGHDFVEARRCSECGVVSERVVAHAATCPALEASDA